MSRPLATTISVILLMFSTGCMMQRLCTPQDMIAMKQQGFAADQIEHSCTATKFDPGAIQAFGSAVTAGMQALADIERARREAEAAR